MDRELSSETQRSGHDQSVAEGQGWPRWIGDENMFLESNRRWDVACCWPLEWRL